MKKKGLLVLAALALAPTIVNADMGAPDAVRYTVTPVREGVECRGWDDTTYLLHTGEVYKSVEYGSMDGETKEISIYVDEDTCTVPVKDVKGVDITSKTPKANKKAVVISKGGLNLRKGPSKAFDKIITIPQFAEIKYGELDSENLETGYTMWLYAEYNGESGWIFAEENIIVNLSESLKIMPIETKEVLNKRTNKNIELKAGEEYTVKHTLYEYCNYCDSVFILNDDLAVKTDYLYVLDDTVYVSFEKDVDIKDSYKAELKDYNKQSSLGTIPKGKKAKVIAHNKYLYGAAWEVDAYYVDYNGVKGFVVSHIDGQDEDISIMLDTYNKKDEECSFSWYKPSKCLTAAEIKIEEEKYNQQHNVYYNEEETTTTSNNEEETTKTLDKQIKEDNNLIVYTIIGVAVGVITTVVIMLLINKKNKNRDASTIEIKDTDTRNISVEEISQEKEEKIEEKDV